MTPSTHQPFSRYSSTTSLQSAGNNLSGRTFLEACGFGRVDVVKDHLAESSFDPNQTYVSRKSGEKVTGAYVAASCGQTKVIQTLISSRKVDMNLKTHYGATPLWGAAHAGHAKVLKELVTVESIELDPIFNGTTPLWEALRRKYTCSAQVLIDTGRVNLDHIKDGKTVRQLAHKAGINLDAPT